MRIDLNSLKVSGTPDMIRAQVTIIGDPVNVLDGPPELIAENLDYSRRKAVQSLLLDILKDDLDREMLGRAYDSISDKRRRGKKGKP